MIQQLKGVKKTLFSCLRVNYDDLGFLSIYGKVKVLFDPGFLCGPRVLRNKFIKACENPRSKGINRV